MTEWDLKLRDGAPGIFSLTAFAIVSGQIA